MVIGSSRCEDSSERENWWEDEWRDGEACRETCNYYAITMGFGCCEARPRDPTDNPEAARSFCGYVPGGGLTNGYSDTKATTCSGDFHERGKDVSRIGSCNTFDSQRNLYNHCNLCTCYNITLLYTPIKYNNKKRMIIFCEHLQAPVYHLMVAPVSK